MQSSYIFRMVHVLASLLKAVCLTVTLMTITFYRRFNYVYVNYVNYV